MEVFEFDVMEILNPVIPAVFQTQEYLKDMYIQESPALFGECIRITVRDEMP